jgi:hypothetical protein
VRFQGVFLRAAFPAAARSSDVRWLARTSPSLEAGAALRAAAVPSCPWAFELSLESPCQWFCELIQQPSYQWSSARRSRLASGLRADAAAVLRAGFRAASERSVDLAVIAAFFQHPMGSDARRFSLVSAVYITLRR